MVTLHHYLYLSALLFFTGVFGVLFRRNLIVIFMSIELMLNAVNLSFVTFSRHLGTMDGHVATFFVMALAAAEAGLAGSPDEITTWGLELVILEAQARAGNGADAVGQLSKLVYLVSATSSFALFCLCGCSSFTFMEQYFDFT